MKRLVICCDGTWNSADQEENGAPCPTNVVKLASRVAKRDGAVAQITYYDQGVGTGNSLDRMTGGAFGDGLEENIHEAYRFLIGNYEPGDEIFIFGFSRGAFTARSLGGMIRKCGILSRTAVRRYREAINLYRGSLHPDEREACAFRDASSICANNPIKIRMIGVWDTVGSLGIPLRGLRFLTKQKHQFHDTELSSSVEHGYHALAIDEYRPPFEPTLWAAKPKEGQTIEQVWFAGAHSDVGGGYPAAGLSDLALEWMIAKASAVGLVFDPAVSSAYPSHPDATGTLHDSKTGLYRLTRPLVRTIGVADTPDGKPTAALDPTQSLHASVRERWDADASYRPQGLRDYFARGGE
jgi:uncharacterized protein (DUF2235 family)